MPHVATTANTAGQPTPAPQQAILPVFPDSSPPGHISPSAAARIPIVKRIGFGVTRVMLMPDGTSQHVYHDYVRQIGQVRNL